MVEKLTTSVSEHERKARGTLPSDLFSRWFGPRDDPLWSTNHNNEDGFNRVYLRPRVLDADPRRQSPRHGRWRRHLIPGDSRAGGCTNAIPSRRRGRYRPRGPACGGLAVGGEAGVLEVLNVLREELYLALPFLQHLRHKQRRSKSGPIPGLACRGAAIRMKPSRGWHFGRLVSTPEIGRHLLKLSSGMQ
jgi:hypothetical protein